MNRVFRVALLLSFIFGLSSAVAQGVLGQIANAIVPGAGTTLDQFHDVIKDNVPIYRQAEEGGSKAVNEAFTQSYAPLVQEAIARSRDDALRAGVQPIPPDMRRNLAGYIPEHILNIARYRIGGGGDLSLQVNAIRYGDAKAITLDYVIVFAEANLALYSPVLWVHELTHVQQYQDWGLRDFAIRYTRDSSSVEAAAANAEQRYMAWVANRNLARSGGAPDGVIPAPQIDRPVHTFPHAGLSSMCGTAVVSCNVGQTVPVGTPCWCNTPNGSPTGSIVPVQNAINIPVAQPQPPIRAALLGSGFTMQMCGCWGQNPNAIAHEPQCMSQQVALVPCSGMCQGGGQPYGYVCR